MILAFISDNQLDNDKMANSILPQFHLHETILFTLSYVKYKQFDFSLLVNGKSIERKVFPSILYEFLGVLFQLEPKVKGMFIYLLLLIFIITCVYLHVHGEGKGK